jgi:hypothetical protein
MDTYWIGPYGIKIPHTIKFVISEDGINYCYSDGSQTVFSYRMSQYMNEIKYKKKYAQQKDGQWYWKKNKIQRILKFMNQKN